MLTPVVLAALAAAAPAVVDHSVDATAPTITVAVDTVPKIKPRLFERRVLFSPEYLNRLLYTVWRASAPEPVVEISPPDETGRAAAYARMYGIDHSLALKIVQHALAEGLDPDLAFRLVRVESVFKPNARGPSGSLGLTQLMPSTARALDRSLRTEAAILDPDANLRTGFRYLRSLIERYDGDVRLGLLAYNRGSGNVDRALKAGRDPENGYSLLVLERVGNSEYDGPGVLDVP